MIKTTLRLAVPLALAATTLAAPGVPAASAAPADRPAATAAVAGIRGWARMDYPVKDDDIRIIVDARGLFTPADPVVPARSWGMFRIQHRMHQPDGQPPLFNWGTSRSTA